MAHNESLGSMVLVDAGGDGNKESTLPSLTFR